MLKLENIKYSHFPHWKIVYGSYSQNKMLSKLEDIADALTRIGVEYDGKDYDQSYSFISQSFARYEGREKVAPSPFSFVVPTRITRSSSMYGSEIHHFLPILRHVGPDVRQAMVVGMPPCVIESYEHKGGVHGGSVVFSPLFSDMITDIKLKPKLLIKLRRITHDTTYFVRDTLKSDIMGLGATLPRLTNLGNNLPTKGLVTTTGHAGTVWLVIKSLEEIINTFMIDSSKPIGLFGPAGSIGYSIAHMILELYPEANMIVKDKNPERTNKAVDGLNKKVGGKRVRAASNNEEVLSSAQVIVSAITARIDLSQCKVDLSGKVIIDDSQPGSFDADQLNSRGAALVWVIGRDASKDRFLTRSSGYTFGDTGLATSSDVWGCEAEVGALSRLNRLDLAVDESINLSLVKNIDGIFKKAGIELADFQEHGRHVDVSHYIAKR